MKWFLIWGRDAKHRETRSERHMFVPHFFGWNAAAAVWLTSSSRNDFYFRFFWMRSNHIRKIYRNNRYCAEQTALNSSTREWINREPIQRMCLPKNMKSIWLRRSHGRMSAQNDNQDLVLWSRHIQPLQHSYAYRGPARRSIFNKIIIRKYINKNQRNNNKYLSSFRMMYCGCSGPVWHLGRMRMKFNRVICA